MNTRNSNDSFVAISKLLARSKARSELVDNANAPISNQPTPEELAATLESNLDLDTQKELPEAGLNKLYFASIPALQITSTEHNQPDTSTVVNDQLSAVNRELDYYYKNDWVNGQHTDDEIFASAYKWANEENLTDEEIFARANVFSFRFNYLINKRRNLIEQQTQHAQTTQTKQNTNSSNKHIKVSFALIGLYAALSIGKKIFDAAKKLIDVADDCCSAIRVQFPTLIPPSAVTIVIGVVAMIVLPYEAVNGAFKALKALKNKDTINRTMKIVAGLSTLAIGLAGSGIAATLIYVGAAAATVAGSALFSTILPIMLIAIYSIALARRSYSIYVVKKKEQAAREIYEKLVAKNPASEMQKLATELLKINKTREEHSKVFNSLLSKVHSHTATAAEKEQLIELKKSLYQANNDYVSKRNEIDNIQSSLKAAKNEYERLREKRLALERKIAFNTVEIAAAGIALAGSILGTAAVIGAASVATMGILPIALIITGVVIGCSVKIFEAIDDHYFQHRLTNGMRNFFTRTWDKITGGKTAELEQGVVPVVAPVVADRRDSRGGLSRSDSHYDLELEDPEHIPSPDPEVPQPLMTPSRIGVVAATLPIAIPQRRKAESLANSPSRLFSGSAPSIRSQSLEDTNRFKKRT